jgi:hypothetical protein
MSAENWDEMSTAILDALGPGGMPIDWQAVADEFEPYDGYLGEPQVGRTFWYLLERFHGGGCDQTTVALRASVILRATPDAPELERMLGVKPNTTLEGQGVKCRACKVKWTAIPENPYYEATTRADGLCLSCVLVETRTDDAVPVLEPTAVRRPRKPVTADE